MAENVNSKTCRSPLDAVVSVFPKASAVNPCREVTLREILEEVKSSKYESQIKALRGLVANGDMATYKERKRQLPAVSLSARLTTREGDIPLPEKLLSLSHVIQIDVDNVENLESLKEKFRADPYVLFFYDSPGGKGLKSGVRIDGTQHLASFHSAEKYFLEKYAIPIDTSVKDLPRLCFVSHDPDLYINEAAQILPITLNGTKPAVDKTAPKQSCSSPPDPGRKLTYGERALDTARKMIEQSVDGEKYNTLLKAGKLLGGYAGGGMLSERDARSLLRSAIENKPNVHSLETAYKGIQESLKCGQQTPIEFDGLERQRMEYLESMGFSRTWEPPGHEAGPVNGDPPPNEWPEGGDSVRTKTNPLNLPPMPEVFTAADLEGMTFREPVWIVPGLIPEGVTLLAGKPKIGKSYAVMNIGLALACGGKALGRVDVEKRGVLYLCLEDQQRRLQNRIGALFCGDNWPANFHLSITWPRIDQGGIPLLQKWLEDHSDVKLVIVDTLAKVKSRKITNKQMYDLDYQCIEALKSVADMMDVSLIVVHHLRKMLAEDDAFDAISGSTGLTGAADTCVILRKDHTGRPLLYIRGRDVEEQELALERDPDGGWTILGDAAALAKTQERGDVLDAMEEGEAVTPAQLAKMTGKKLSNIHYLLKHLIDDEQVRKTSYGKYIKCVSTNSTESTESTNTPDSTDSVGGKLPVTLKESVPPLIVSSATTKGFREESVLSGVSVESIICFECEHFEINPHMPNKQGRCKGVPWDNDPDQWPKLKHDCPGFRERGGLQNDKRHL